MEFFRHCPTCGRRFHIRLESKMLVGTERTSSPTRTLTNIGSQPRSRFSGGSLGVYQLEGGKPLIVEIREFQYTFKCKHCGHEWTEKRVQEEAEHEAGEEPASTVDLEREAELAKEEQYAREDL